VEIAARTCPSVGQKTVTMQVLRHTAAMRLLRAAIDTPVIAPWLGHEQIETTQIHLLAWRSEFGTQFGQARGQAADLPALRLDLRILRQDQGDQVVVGQGEEGCAVHASP